MSRAWPIDDATPTHSHTYSMVRGLEEVYAIVGLVHHTNHWYGTHHCNRNIKFQQALKFLQISF